jgi:threonine dehydrogenase-like Zn-dependent dehydrogenase
MLDRKETITLGATDKATVVVQTARQKYSLRELPLPRIGSDDGLIEIEACGACGCSSHSYSLADAETAVRSITVEPKPMHVRIEPAA